MADFKGAHRRASEYLLSAIEQTDVRLALRDLDKSQHCGQKALNDAEGAVEVLVASGLLQAVDGVRALLGSSRGKREVP